MANFGSSEFSRKQLLQAMGLTVGGLALGGSLASCATDSGGGTTGGSTPGGGGGSSEGLTIVATGGAFEEALTEFFYEPFTKETGIPITPVVAAADQWPRLKVLVEAGQSEWDIVTAQAFDLFTHADLVDPMTAADVPNAEKLGQPGTLFQNGLFRTHGAYVLVYNTEVFPGDTGPKSWADFWDTKKFPGPRGMANDGNHQNPIIAALQADGVAKEDLLPLDLDRGFAKLDELRDDIAVWWTSGDQGQQILRDREVVMTMLFSGRSLSLIKEGQPLNIVWDGAPNDVPYWAITRGTPRRANALKFIDWWMTRPEAHVEFMKRVNYVTANKEAISMLDGVDRTNAELAVSDRVARVNTTEWMAKNAGMINDRWNAWFAA